ncbi:hypothetical protein V5738_13390 [Salinisphaera sp. SPP-AMP-43]|uniref:hypothetical protein n=1 Tax=Salinisphaera sp. SPP-AMP-43 TaxID=3121288 RepID=UPI003C6E49C9
MSQRKARQVIPDTLDGEAIVHVELTRGQWAIVDAADWPAIRETFGELWAATPRKGGKFGAGRNLKTLDGRRLNYSLGKAVLQPKQGLYVTVKNGDSLDNRRHNLQVEGMALPHNPGAVPVCLATDEDRAAYERQREKAQRGRRAKPEAHALPEHVARRQAEHYRRVSERNQRSGGIPDRGRCQRRADGPELTVKPKVGPEHDSMNTLQAVLVAELRRAEGVGQAGAE